MPMGAAICFCVRVYVKIDIAKSSFFLPELPVKELAVKTGYVKTAVLFGPNPLF